jgi:PAS domain S-box-containing protein
MNSEEPTPSLDASEEISALAETLVATQQRLEELTAGEVDTVAGRDGRTFLLGRAQEQLRHSEAAKQAAILDALPAHIALLDSQGTIISVNQAWRRFADANMLDSHRHGIGRNYLDICDRSRGDGSSDAHHVAAGIRAVLSGREKSFSAEYSCHSPTERRWFHLTVTPLADGRPNGAVVMHLNITARKLAADALRLSEERLRAALAASCTGTFRWDIGTNEVNWDDALDALFGIPQGQAVRTLEKFIAAVHPDDRDGVLEGCARCAREGADFDMEFRVLWPDGSLHWLNDRGKTISNAAGRPMYMTGACVDITERKRAEEASRQSEEKFREVADNITDVFWMMSHDMNKTLYISKAYETVWGFSMQSLYADPHQWVNAILPEDREAALAAFVGLTKDVPSVNVEYRIMRPDGTVRWVHDRGFQVRDAAGRLVRNAGVASDITERKKAAEALRESEAEFRALAEAMPQMVWITRADGWSIYFSQQWMDYTGLTLAESLGTGWNKPFYPEDQQRAWDAWHHALATTEPYSIECRLRRADGVYRWWLIRGVPQKDASGKVLKWFGTCTDIHELKLAELEISSTNQALRESNEKFHQLADNITDAFWIRSPDMSEVQYVSPAFDQIWGRSREGLYSNPQQWADSILPEDRERVLAAFTALTGDAASLDIEYRIVWPGGEIRWVRVRGFQVRTTAGKLIRHTGIITDITERKRADIRVEALHKELLVASRRAGMTEVATGVLHNVGNVLNSVNVSTSLVVERLRKSSVPRLTEVVKLMSDRVLDLTEFLTLDERGRRLPQYLAHLALQLNRETQEITAEMHAVAANVDHIKEIVNAQQSYAGTFGVLEPLDLRESIEDALRIHTGALNRHNIDIVRNLEPIAAVLADKHKLLQILVNLIANAKHAMIGSPVKTLTIKTCASCEGGSQLSIADTGYGIVAENLTRIFAHGFTTKKDGHGFGLHSSALASREMNASLLAHSDGVGHGAIFTLVFQPANPRRVVV